MGEAVSLLESKVVQLERQLKGLLKEDRLVEASEIILDQIKIESEAYYASLSQKALDELRHKFLKGWPNGEYSFSGPKMGRVDHPEFSVRWGFEKELLEEDNARAVQRLWSESKEKIEERYGMFFDSRKDFALLHKFFDSFDSLQSAKDSLSRRLREYNNYVEKLKDYPEAVDIFFKHELRPSVAWVGDRLLSLMMDLEDPYVFFHQDEDDDWLDIDHHSGALEGREQSMLSLHGGHSPNMSYHDDVQHSTETYMDLLVEARQGRLTFSKALYMINQRYFDAAEMKIDIKGQYWRDNKPESVQKVIDDKLVSSYNEGSDLDFNQFMDWFKGHLLNRWKSTAVDYERIFDYYTPGPDDERIIEFFYKKLRLEGNIGELVWGDRLPGVLKALVEDGYLKKEEIDPPLKAKYHKPNELPFNKDRLLSDGTSIDEAIEFNFVPGKQKIVTSAEDMKALPNALGNLPQIIRDNDLASVISPDKVYKVIYKGNHVMFVQDFETDSLNRTWGGDVYRLSLHKGEEIPDIGAIMEIGGYKLHIKPQKRLNDYGKAFLEVFDVTSDALPIRDYVAVVDISPEKFKEKYLKDFMAHVFLFGCGLTDEVHDKLKDLDDGKFDLNPTDIGTSLSAWGHAYLRTFELGGKFGFKLKYDSQFGRGEINKIANTLVSYLYDVGLSVHHDLGLDESGRKLMKIKKEERIFNEENLGAVVESLKDEKLLPILLFAIYDKNYRSELHLSSQECKHCNNRYFAGKIYNPNVDRDSHHGVDGSILHILSKHPELYPNVVGDLKKVVRLIKDAEEKKPLFMQYPEIIPQLRKLDKVKEKADHWRSVSFDFWHSHQGGYSYLRDSPEKWQDNPDLHEYWYEEQDIHRKEMYFEKRFTREAKKMQNLYEKVSGILPIDEKTEDISHRWNKEAYAFWVMSIIAPTQYKLLEK